VHTTLYLQGPYGTFPKAYHSFVDAEKTVFRAFSRIFPVFDQIRQIPPKPAKTPNLTTFTRIWTSQSLQRSPKDLPKTSKDLQRSPQTRQRSPQTRQRSPQNPRKPAKDLQKSPILGTKIRQIHKRSLQVDARSRSRTREPLQTSTWTQELELLDRDLGPDPDLRSPDPRNPRILEVRPPDRRSRSPDLASRISESRAQLQIRRPWTPDLQILELRSQLW